jgi:hypothetical protein
MVSELYHIFLTKDKYSLTSLYHIFTQSITKHLRSNNFINTVTSSSQYSESSFLGFFFEGEAKS